MARKLSHLLEGNSLLPPYQFSYRKGLGICNALLIFSHHLQVAIDRGIDFSVAFDTVSHRGLLYKLRFIGFGRQFLSIVSEFPSDRRQRNVFGW